MFKCDNCSAEYKVDHEMDKEHYIPIYCPFCGWEREESDEEYLNDISFHDSDDCYRYTAYMKVGDVV